MNNKYAQAELDSKPETVVSSNPYKKYQVITVSLLLVIGIINYVDRSALSSTLSAMQRDGLLTIDRRRVCLKKAEGL